MTGSTERLRDAYRQNGLSGFAETLGGYIRWRLAGSPVEVPDEDTRAWLERTDSAVVVALMRDFYSKASPSESLLISVILPTRDRPDRLLRAVNSVLEQRYTNWELIVVNDSPQPLPELPADERIRIVESSGSGVSKARNRGLDTSAGDLITFLDDDNLMDDLWLKALAVAIEQAPNTQVLIGAQLVTPDPGESHRHMIRFPSNFDWDRLIEANYVDMGMLAHRSRPDLRFDESLPSLVDWDYVVRLTIDATPVLVPAVAGLYLTDSTNRISYSDRQALVGQVKQRFAAMKKDRENLAASEIWKPDLQALVHLAKRFQETRGRIPSVGTMGETALSRSVLEALAAAEVADVVADSPVDILFVEEAPDEAGLTKLLDDGFLIGLNSHRVDYSKLGFPHARPVGDHLWIGSRAAFEPEDLFEGGTLVKFGIPREF